MVLRKLLLGLGGLMALPSAYAWAGDPPILLGQPSSYAPTPRNPPLFSGWYLGANVGYGWSNTVTNFTFTRFGAPFADAPASPSSYKLQPSGVLGGPELGFNFHFGNVVIGPAADFSASDISGSRSISGIDAGAIPFTSRQTEDLRWLSTYRARLGFTALPKLLIYGTGGLAIGEVNHAGTVTFSTGETYTGSRTETKAGWTAGAGAEYAITNRWSAKLEYLHYDLGKLSTIQFPKPLTSFEGQADSAVNGNIVRVGVNYAFGGPSGVMPTSLGVPDFLSIATEIGMRYFWSIGTTKYPLMNLAGSAMVSQLTYHGLDANAGEAFARLEHSSGVFVKGYAGGGWVDSGSLKDEDFPPFISPYSATHSVQNNGDLGYVTADIGYDMMKLDMFRRAIPNARFGPFVGYNYYHETLNAYGCGQTAGNTSVCTPTIPNSTLVITQDSDWQAMRLGLAGDITLFGKLNSAPTQHGCQSEASAARTRIGCAPMWRAEALAARRRSAAMRAARNSK